MKLIPTTAEVYCALMSAHWKQETLKIYGSCTQVEEGYIMTSYYLAGSDYPLIRAESTWDSRDGYKTSEDREHKYWLYILEKEDDEWT